MEKLFSRAWKSSNQPRKQRKYVYNAPTHLRGTFMSAHLSKSLRNEFGRRSARVVKGDKIKIVRGSFKGVSGVVLRVDTARGKIYLKEASRKKVAGAEVQLGIQPSNVMIIEPEMRDSKRMKALKGGRPAKGEPKKEAAIAQAPRKEAAEKGAAKEVDGSKAK